MTRGTVAVREGRASARPDHHRAAVRATVGGALLGLAWGLSLRAWMAVLQVGSFGYLPDFTWWGTFGSVAAPAVATGAVLGWAEGVRRAGGRRGWRWAAAAPLLMVVPVALTPGFLETFLDTGLGGGAIGVALIGLTGGYSLSGRGPRAGRLTAGVVALALTLATAGLTHFSAPEPLSPAPVFGAVLFSTLMGVFAVAASVPHRPVVTPGPLPPE